MNLINKVGIVFTTPYFQILAGQEIKKIERETVNKDEMNLICDGKSEYNSKRNILFISKDERGKLLKTCYIDEKGKMIGGNYLIPNLSNLF